MSKKHLHRIIPFLRLTLACALIILPGSFTLSGEGIWLQSGLTAALALAIANLVLKLGIVPWPFSFIWLVPMIYPLFITLLPLNHVYTVAFLLGPWALFLLVIAKRWFSGIRWMMFPSAWVILTLLTNPVIGSFVHLPPGNVPYLIHNLDMWIFVLLLFPAGLAFRSFLRKTARIMIKTELTLFLLPLVIAPLVWLVPTSFKETGETRLHLHVLSPLPQLTINTGFDWQSYLPEDLQTHPDPLLALRAWNQTTRLLSKPSLLRAFSGNDLNFEPDKMVWALTIYDFIHQDKYGYWVSESSFFRSPPPEMDPAAEKWIERLHAHVTMTPRRLAALLGLSNQEALVLLRQLDTRDLVTRVQGETDRYIATWVSRKPMNGGLYPRNLLLVANATEESPTLSRKIYTDTWGLTDAEVSQEFDALLKAGLLTENPEWTPTQHRALMQNGDLWRRAALHMAALLIALLAGICLPVDIPRKANYLDIPLAFLVMFPWDLPLLLLFPIRTAMALWMLRHHGLSKKPVLNRVSTFAAMTAWTTFMPSLLSETAGLELQSAWATFWLPPAFLLLFWILRPLPDSSAPPEIAK